MKWLKIQDSGGYRTFNLDNVSQIERYSTTNIRFYLNGSSTPTTLTFASEGDRNEMMEKLYSITSSVDVNRISTQQ